MKVIQPGTGIKPYKHSSFWAAIAVIIIAGALKDFEIVNDLTFKAILVAGFAIVTLMRLYAESPKNVTLAKFIEWEVIGMYEPEDERDQAIKLEAAMATLRTVMLINWLIFTYFFVTRSGFLGFGHPAALVALGVNASGIIVFNRFMRKRGVEFDVDRLDQEARAKRAAKKKA